jgi:anti-anti-sigma regulatory factor/HAMP domain-containing protein
MRLMRLRLSTQLLLLTVGTAVVAIILLVAMAVALSSEVVQQEGDQRLTALAETTGDLITAPLAAHDTAAVQRILSAAVRDEGLDRAFVLAPDRTMVAAQHSERVDEDDLSTDDQDFALSALRANQLRTRNDTDNLVDIAVPIAQNDQAVGVLLGQSSTSGAIDELIGTTLPQMSAAGLGVALLAGLVALALARRIAAPLQKLSVAAMAVGQGQLEALPAQRGNAEVGALASAFGQMVDDLRASRAAVAEQQRTLEVRVQERTADLERALAELRESVSVREQLSATVRELASPIVPVLDGIVVMPLVGAIDSQRAAMLIDTLLHGVEHHRASMVILDVTGVPIIDTQVARTLLDAARAVKLLGTQTMLVGLRPELAQTIVGLGLDLSELSTRADLQSGVSYAMRQRQRRGSATQ